MKNLNLTVKELLIAIIHRWKMIVVVALAVSLLLAFLNTSLFPTQYDQDMIQYGKDIAQYDKDLIQYDKDLAAFDKSSKQFERDYLKYLSDYDKYELSISTNERQLQEKKTLRSQNEERITPIKAYLDKSLLMRIDPYKKTIASATISIQLTDSLYTGTSPNAYDNRAYLTEYFSKKIADQYIVIMTYTSYSDVIKSALTIPAGEEDLREVIQVLQTGDTGIITIRVFEVPGLDSEKAISLLLEYLFSKKAAIENESIGHKLTVIDQNRRSSYDASLFDQQTRLNQQVKDSETLARALNWDISVLESNKFYAPIAPDSPIKPTEPVKPAKPAAGDVITGSSLREFIKRVLFGIIPSLLVGILVASVLYYVSFPVQTPEQLQDQLGVLYLGGIKRKDRFAHRLLNRKLVGYYLLADEKDAPHIMMHKIQSAKPGIRSIYLTGTVPLASISKIAEKLNQYSKDHDSGVSFTFGENIERAPSSILDMKEAEAVVIVERLQDSRMHQVSREAERIRSSETELLGYVLV